MKLVLINFINVGVSEDVKTGCTIQSHISQTRVMVLKFQIKLHVADKVNQNAGIISRYLLLSMADILHLVCLQHWSKATRQSSGF